MDQPWYVELFDKDYLRINTGVLTPELTGREVDFIVEALKLPPGASILDLCCGHGRHTIELARRGYSMAGQDLSEPFLAQARREAANAGVQVEWVHADMRQIPFGNQLDACLNWYTSFGYLENDEEDQKVLDAVQRALKPGGKFLIDLTNHAWLMRNYMPRDWSSTPRGEMIFEERHFNSLTGRNEFKVTRMSPGGQITMSDHSVRIYTLVELANMLAVASLEVSNVWGDSTGAPYSLNSRRMIVLAVK